LSNTKRCIPPSALEDETFAALITEAEKYIGYPYVWGGSNPNTSFDCSGFVSWVLTQSGVCNTGRLGAQGLYNISTPVSSANARPGDLIFFDWDDGGQDGSSDHVGIVEKVENGRVYTVEGNSGDSVRQNSYPVGYYEIYGYGTPAY